MRERKLRERDRLKKKFNEKTATAARQELSAAEDLTEVHTFVHHRQNSENILQIVRLLPSWYTHTDEIEHLYIQTVMHFYPPRKYFLKSSSGKLF